MTTSHPRTAHVEHLRRRARSLLKAHGRGDAEAQRRFLAYFPEEPSPGLQAAQLVVARERGFPSWRALLAADSRRCTALPDQPLAALELTLATSRRLAAHGIRGIGPLAALSEEKLRVLGLAAQQVLEVREVLASRGL